MEWNQRKIICDRSSQVPPGKFAYQVQPGKYRAYPTYSYEKEEKMIYSNQFEIKEAICHTSPLWSWEYCSSDCPCGAGQGDCDTDVDCALGLYCVRNVGAKYGQISGIDVCEITELEECTKKEKLWAEYCYATVAIERGERDICEKGIENQTYKNYCLKTIKKKPLGPEEVAVKFFYRYEFSGKNRIEIIRKSPDITEEYRQEIIRLLKSIILVDPVIFAQDSPTRIEVKKVKIVNQKAFVKVDLFYGHYVEVELLLIDNQWKINYIGFIGKEK